MGKFKIEKSDTFTQEEMYLLCLYGAMLQSADDKSLRDLYNILKSRYQSLDGLLKGCYPFQNEKGRPSRMIRNKTTGVMEWQAYKRINDGAAKNIIIESLFNKPIPGTRTIIVEIHPDGEPVDKKLIINDMKDDTNIVLEDCSSLVQDARDTLEMVKDDEEMAYDNLPEGIQMSERGDSMQEGIDALDEAISYLDDVISYLDDAESAEVREYLVEKTPWDDIREGDAVSHKVFGNGLISVLENGKVTVHFPLKDARFSFPDAFVKGYLKIISK